MYPSQAVVVAGICFILGMILLVDALRKKRR
jgi:hypothetical protein